VVGAYLILLSVLIFHLLMIKNSVIIRDLEEDGGHNDESCRGGVGHAHTAYCPRYRQLINTSTHFQCNFLKKFLIFVRNSSFMRAYFLHSNKNLILN
jgi:hypothetical protein